MDKKARDKPIDSLVEKMINKIVRPELDKLTARVAEQDKRIEEGFAELNEKFNTFAHRVFSFLEDQDKKITRVSVEINERFNKIFSTFDYILKRMETAETEYFAITETLKRIETKITPLEENIAAVGKLSDKTKELDKRTQETDIKIQELEKRIG